MLGSIVRRLDELVVTLALFASCVELKPTLRGSVRVDAFNCSIASTIILEDATLRASFARRTTVINCSTLAETCSTVVTPNGLWIGSTRVRLCPC